MTSRRKLRIPDTFSILLIIMALFILLTWIIPAGEYDRATTQVGGLQKEVLIPGTYKTVTPSPQGPGAFLTAPVKGFTAAAQIIGFCFLVGGAFGIFNRSGAIEAGIRNILSRSNNHPGRKKTIICIIMVLFSLAGATFGMSESVLVFIMITIPLAIAMGYDSIVGVSISFLAAGTGFAGAFLNPFTIGIAQGIAEIPLFSGWLYRIIIWVILTAAAIIFVLNYISKLEKGTIKGYINKKTDFSFPEDTEQKISRRHRRILIILATTFLVLIIGSSLWKWYINEIAGLFLAAAIIVAFTGKMKSSDAMQAFVEGAKGMTMAALVIGISRGLLIIATDGKIIDTMLHGLAVRTEGFSPAITAQLMFLIQGGINFFVPSGSGQAALTMPVMAPLSDLVGISRQTAVLAFQLGDGIFNMIIPTSGVTMGAMSIAGIPYQKWVKWLWPLILILTILSILLLIPPALLFNY